MATPKITLRKSGETLQFNKDSRLSELHQAEFVLLRKLPLEWAEANAKSIDESEAGVILRYPAKSKGFVLMSAEYGQWQFRPDNPWPSLNAKKGDRPPKYRTPKDEYDVFLPNHLADKTYWTDIDALKERCPVINSKRYATLTEGGINAITGCFHGIPTAGLVGVTMGLTPKDKGEPDLVPGLKRLVKDLVAADIGIVIAFDADSRTNNNVRIAETKLAKVLQSYNCDVLSVTGHWEETAGNGMDDFINKNDIEAFRAILTKAVPIGETLDTGDKKTKKPPTAQVMTARLAEEFGHQLKYDEEQQTWRKWSGKHWEKMGLGAFKSWLKNTLDGKGVNYGGSAYLEDVRKLLECDLRQLKWKFWDKSRYINFNNCVFDGAKAQSEPHCPGMGFTSHLPYDYKPLEGDLSNSLEALQVNCPKVYQFFRTAMQGDERKMFKLLAIINALLKYRFFDLQMFVHLVGAPGSGKGKFMRFCQKLVGKSNTIACHIMSGSITIVK